MCPFFRLFWLRETGCDAGTPLRAAALESKLQSAVAQSRILELDGMESDVTTSIELRLPYLDRREWRRRGEILAGYQWQRRGSAIFPVLPPGTALRDAAASLALTDPVWAAQPAPSDARYFAAWRDVSVAVQIGFREWIAQEYFRDVNCLSDREAAYPMIVYQAARVYHGRPRGVFAYDLRDYPECRLTLALATKMTGRTLQTLLADIEERLRAAGKPELARRYAPLWHHDVLAAVRKKPKEFIALLAAESTFINALVELGVNRTPQGVHSFSKVANQALRNVYGMDVRHLGIRALQETTRVLAQHCGGPAGGEAPVLR